MKKLKQLLSILIVSALVCAYLPALSGFAEIVNVEVGGSYEITLADDSDVKNLTFSPTETAIYLFYTESEEPCDPMITVEASDGTGVIWADDSGSTDFLAGAEFTAGETYNIILSCCNVEGGKTTLYCIENIIDSVSIDDVEIIEGDNTTTGEYWDEETGTPSSYDIYEYSLNGTVYLKGGQTAEIEDGWVEILGKNLFIQPHDDQAYNNQWGIGSYQGSASLLGTSFSYNVNISSSPVDGIYIAPVTIYEGVDSSEEYYWDDASNEGKYWSRFLYSLNGSITLKEGEPLEIIDGFFTWNGEPYGLAWEDPQNPDNLWSVGSTYEVPVAALGATTILRVTILPSPFAEIVVEDVTVGPQNLTMGNSYDNETDSWVDWDMYTYHVNGYVSLKEGGIIPIEDNNLCYNGTYYCLNIHEHGQDFRNPWEENNTYPVSGTWLGLPYSFNVTVLGSPVSSLTLNDVTVYDRLDSFINYEYNEETEEQEPYKAFSIPVSGTISFNDGRPDLVFDSSSFEFEGEPVSVDITHNQGLGNQWAVGSTYEVTATVLGATATFKVTVEACPIKKVVLKNEVVDSANFGIYYDYNENTGEHDLEYKYYYYSVNGTIYMTDGTSVPIENDWFFLNDEPHTVSVEDTQGYNNEWNEGGTYAVTAYVYNLPTEFYVTVMPSPIKSFTVDTLEYYEHIGGFFSEYWDEETQSSKEFFYYEYSLSGTVTLSNGRVINYTNGEFFVNGKQYYVYLWDSQYEMPWTLGTQQATAILEGTEMKSDLTVKVNPSPIDYVEAEDLTLYKGIHNNEGTEYVYSPSYTVYLKDGTELYSDSFGYAYLEGAGELSLEVRDTQSEETPWDIGTHQVQIVVGGKEAAFDVTIEESPYTAIEISGTSTLTVSFVRADGGKDTFHVNRFDIFEAGLGENTYLFGYLVCDEGVIPGATFTFSDSSYITDITLYVGEIESNTLEKNSYIRASLFGYGYVWALASANYYSHQGLLPEFADDISEMDIDLLCFIAAALSTREPLEEVYSGELCYIVHRVEDIENSLYYNLGIENLDLSSASGYQKNGEGTITNLAPYDSDFVEGELEFNLTESGWTVYVNAYQEGRVESITVNLNLDAVMTSFEVKTNRLGDMSGEGEITTEDAVLILKYLAGYNVEIPERLADINLDRVIDVADAVLLLQHVAGYDVGL